MNNFSIKDLPEREKKPRKKGLTFVIDKGLSIREAEDFVEMCSGFTDVVKLGWATSYLTNRLKDKLSLYESAGIMPCFGGSLFEIFYIRNSMDEYFRTLDKYKMKITEISDGSLTLNHNLKCEYINKLSKYIKVVSEVGSKDPNVNIPAYKWIDLMQTELDAGSWKVIAEAREGGNVGVYEPNHEVRSGLVDEILTKINSGSVIWEAPLKSQQVWFIKLLGTNVNLGNIQINEVIPLETLRLGLRSDTFHHFLQKKETLKLIIDRRKR